MSLKPMSLRSTSCNHIAPPSEAKGRFDGSIRVTTRRFWYTSICFARACLLIDTWGTKVHSSCRKMFDATVSPMVRFPYSSSDRL